MRKRISSYYMHIDRIAMDVFRVGNVYRITAADYKTKARLEYTMSGQFISSTKYDEELFALAGETVRRNLKILRRLARERECKRKIIIQSINGFIAVTACGRLLRMLKSMYRQLKWCSIKECAVKVVRFIGDILKAVSAFGR